jgi:hypothetical protein
MLQYLRGSMNILKDFKFQINPYLIPLFQRYYYDPIYFPFFHHILGLIILFFPRKVVRIFFQIFKLEIAFEKRETNDPNSHL